MIFLALIATIIAYALAGFLFAVPVMFLWNWIMPLLGLTTLTYMQSWGLFVLISLLMKSKITKEK